VTVRVGLDAADAPHVSLPCPSQSRSTVGVAQPHTPRLGGHQGLPGALGDCLTLLLSHQGHDAHGQVVGLRHVSSDESDAAVPEREQKGSVTREPVQLCDDQGRPCHLGEMQGLGQLWAGVNLAALDLHEGANKDGVLGTDMFLNGSILSLKP